MSKTPHISTDAIDATLHTLGGLIEALDTVLHDMPALTASTREAQMVQALIDTITQSTATAVAQSADISRNLRKGRIDV